MVELSAGRLGALRDYYLNKRDGQGDYEDIFSHIDAVEAERDALREALVTIKDGRPSQANLSGPQCREIARAALERPE